MKESDWKHFTKFKHQAIEEFCAKALNECEEAITKSNHCAHERYLYLSKFVDIRNREMAMIFEDHGRTKARIKLLAMRMKKNLVSEDDLENFSPEFRKKLTPLKFDLKA